MPQRKNVHQLHIEQLVSMGEEGLEEINYKLSNFINSFNDTNDNLNITTKIDGAPAVICWHKLAGYPDDSICLKSFVNGAQNALSSKGQIEKKYGDRPNMAAMLMFCLEIAKEIPSGQAWQGDCLFTSNTKKVKNINGKECIVFQPNKVVYAFSEDNPGYEKIKAANFGICFHTIYKLTGKGLSQSFRIDPTVLNVPEDIYIMSPAVNTPKMGFDVSQAEEDYSKLQELEKKLLNNPAYEELVNNEIFKQFWPMFENHITSDKASTTINVNEFYKELTDFIKEKHDNEYNNRVAKLKTDKGKERAKTAYDSEVVEIANLLKTNKDILTDMVNVFNQVVKIKMDIFKYLKNAPRDYDTYLYKASGEYEPTSGEGYSLSDQDGNIVKLVDRSEFAHANRSKDYLSGFEHESLEEAEEDNKIKIIVDIQDTTNEDVLTGNPDDYTEEMISEWFDFVYDVEDVIEEYGDIISTEESNVINSLSEYIDFYLRDKDGNRKKCLVDLRLSDHRQTGNARKKRRAEVDKLDTNHTFITITVNDKVFKSYNEALAYLRKILNKTNSELDEKIVKKGSQYQVQSEKGRNMGTYDTKAEAKKRLQQVHYFKYKNEDLDEDVDTNSLINNLENIEQDNIYSEVNIIDDWGKGKDIEANYYDYDDNNVANLIVRVYNEPNRKGICFREINVEQQLQGTGFAKKLVKACLDSIDKDNDIVLVHLDFSGGFWQHMKKEFPDYNWDKTIKNEGLDEDNFDETLEEDMYSFGDIDD